MLTASGDNGYEEFERIKCIKQAVFVDAFLEICTKGEIGGRIHTGEVYEKKGTTKEGEEGERLSFHYWASFTVW